MSLDTTASGLTTVSAPIADVLDGTQLGVRGRAECSGPECHRSLRDGAPVALRAHRLSDEAAWSDTAVYCMDCVPEWGQIGTSTPGAEECVVSGRLVTRSDSAQQTSQLAFRAGESRSDVLDYSATAER